MIFIQAFTTKRDDFGFPIVNFPWLSGDVPILPSYGVYISQLVRFARCYASVSDFHSKNLPTTDTRLQISQASKIIWKVLQVIILTFDLYLVKYCFKNLFRQESLIRSSTAILSTN